MPMQKVVHVSSILVAAMLLPATVASAPAAVLCQKPSGVVVVRAACKKKETVLDLAQFGAVGPKGDPGQPGPAGSIEGAPAGGDLSGTYPAPTIAAAPAPTVVADNPETLTDPCAGPTPQTGVYCGTSSRFWGVRSGNPGIGFWRDRLGAVHIAGTAGVSSGDVLVDEIIFYLPENARPDRSEVFPIVAVQSSGVPEPRAGVLQVQPDGAVRVLTDVASPRPRVQLGNVEFRN